jgi:hypothetical protein
MVIIIVLVIMVTLILNIPGLDVLHILGVVVNDDHDVASA